MKKHILIMIYFLTYTQVSLGQGKNNSTGEIDSLKNMEIVNSEDHWIGNRIGVQRDTYKTIENRKMIINYNKFSKISYWISIGFGKSYFGATFGFKCSYTSSDNEFNIRYLKADEFRFNVEGHYTEPQLKMKEFGLLYGKMFKQKFLVLSILGGISYLDGVDRGNLILNNDYEKINISTFGLPLEVKIRLEITKNFGLGGSFFGNVNNKNIFWGGMFEVFFGEFDIQ